MLNFLGFIGFYGMFISFAEAVLTGELTQFNNLASDNIPTAIANYLGLAAVEFAVYSTIPFYVSRSGATLLQLSDTTTIVWSMLFDCLLYNSKL